MKDTLVPLLAQFLQVLQTLQTPPKGLVEICKLKFAEFFVSALQDSEFVSKDIGSGDLLCNSRERNLYQDQSPQGKSHHRLDT